MFDNQQFTFKEPIFIKERIKTKDMAVNLIGKFS